ncbi:MAG: YceI family protein [Robiginitomaculum sp.]|nr:YceI family protein [Robiginitomaculum sp.]
MRSVFVIFILVFGVFLAPDVRAQDSAKTQSNWAVDKSTSSIAFSGEQTGEKFTGSFANFDVQITFSPDDLAGAKIVAVIDLASVDAGDKDRNGALPGKEWFFVKKFPKARFEATGFKHLGGNAYETTGQLTIRGVDKTITLPFTLDIEGGQAAMQGQISLNRRDYNIGTGMWKNEDWVKHNVNVQVVINAKALLD